MSSSPFANSKAENKMSGLYSTSSSKPVNLKMNGDHYANILAVQLSFETMATLGEMSDEVHHDTHSLPSKLLGRRALVYFEDEPSEYYVVQASGKRCILSPTPSPTSAVSFGPPIHIDPRGLVNPAEQLPVIKMSDKPDPRAYKSRDSGTPVKTEAGSSSSGMAGGLGGKGGQQGGKGSDGDRSNSDGSKKDPRNPGGKRGKYISYNVGGKDAVLMQTSLPQMVIGAIEFLIFFPNHTQWPALMLRLIGNGWTAKDIAKVQLHFRGILTRQELHRRHAAIRHQIKTIATGNYNMTMSKMKSDGHAHVQPFTDHTSGSNHDLYDVRLPVQTSGLMYEPPRNLDTLSDPPIIDEVLNGVVTMPTLQDEGVLTKALKYCQRNGQTGQNTDYLATVIAAQTLHHPSDAAIKDWDTRALNRFREAVADP